MGILSTVSALFRARLHIGYLAIPYVLFGFFINWSLHSFNIDMIFKPDTGESILYGSPVLRILYSSLIAFIYMAYLFVINDYFDAEFDKLDEKKSKRNPFCDSTFKNNSFVKFLIFSPTIVILILGFLISREAGITTILALFLGTYYSAPPFRFKERKFSDFIVHGFCLGIYFFSLGFFSIWSTPNYAFLPLFWLVMYLSFVDAAWIHLDSALVDYYVDKKGGVNTTVVSLGPQKSLTILFLLLLSILFVPSFFFLSVSDIFNKYSFLAIFLLISYLSLPTTYAYFFIKAKANFERARTISSRYRVYVMFTIVPMTIVLTNKIIYG